MDQLKRGEVVSALGQILDIPGNLEFWGILKGSLKGRLVSDRPDRLVVTPISKWAYKRGTGGREGPHLNPPPVSPSLLQSTYKATVWFEG